MCFDPVTIGIMVATAAAATLSKVVSDKLSMNAQNEASVDSYNQKSRYAEKVNRAALQQQAETDYRNRTDNRRQAETAADKARAAILENRRAMSTARASAGTSGMMGLPLNIITQNYEALIGGIGTNLQSQYQQMDENYFFNSMDSMMRAQNITNQAIPEKPYLQKYGWGNALSALLAGATAGLSVLGGASGGGGGDPTGGAGTATSSGGDWASGSGGMGAGGGLEASGGTGAGEMAVVA